MLIQAKYQDQPGNDDYAAAHPEEAGDEPRPDAQQDGAHWGIHRAMVGKGFLSAPQR